MKRKDAISGHEMLRRFALGEVDSSVFFPSGFDREDVRRKLLSDEIALQVEGMAPLLEKRSWVRDLPQSGLRWHIASLELTVTEFGLLSTYPDELWTTYTGRTHRLIDAAEAIRRDRLLDTRCGRRTSRVGRCVGSSAHRIG